MTRAILITSLLVSLSACDAYNDAQKRRQYQDDERRVCVRLEDGVVFKGHQGFMGVISYPDENGVYQEVNAKNSHKFKCRRLNEGEVQ